MIRVLQMIGCFEAVGSQAMIMNLFLNIDRSKIMFDFIIDHPERDYYEAEARALGAKIYYMPSFKGYNLFEIKNKWNAFFSEHPEYTVLHSHVRSYASVYIPIAKKHGVKTIIHSHSTSNGKGAAAVVKRIMQYPLRYEADYLMSCSGKAGRWLYGAKACEKPNYIFLPNAIETEKYGFSEEESAKCRKEFGLEGKFVLGHIGRFHESKNHMFLLEVFAEVCKKRTDAVLLLVGDGELRDKIEAKIHDLKIEDRVVLTGKRNDVPHLLQAMDIFVFPSKWEGLPVTVVEAQATGLPCIISDKITKDVDVSELVKRLPTDDPKAWAQEIIATPTERKNVTDKIKKAGFDVKDTARRLTDFYMSVGGSND